MFRVVKQVDTTDEGLHYETPGDTTETVPEYRTFTISFDDVDRQHQEEFEPLIRPHDKIFIPSYTQPRCFYGIVPNTTLEEDRKKSGDAFNIRFLEHAMGGPQT